MFGQTLSGRNLMKKWSPVIQTLVLGLFVLSLLAGCSLQPDRVTRENYDKLELGMTYEAVKDILGEPKESGSRLGVKQHTWVEGDRQIHAKFIADRAVYYSSKGLELAAQKGTRPAGH
jgi:hypothetical protein